MQNESFEIGGSLLARNTLLNLVGLGVPLVVAVVTIPLIIQGLGADRFGILVLAWTVLGYFSIFDLGLGRAVTKFVSEALGKGEQEKMLAITWTSVIVQAVFGILGGLVLAAITPLLVDHILNIPQRLVIEARSGFYLLAFSIPVTLISSSFRGILEAAQRFDLVNAVRVPYGTTNYLLPLVGVILRWDLPGIFALMVISRALTLIVQYWLCTCVFPSLKVPRFYRKELHVLFGFGGWVTVSNVVGPVLVYLGRFIVGTLLTMTAVTYYSAPYEVVTRLLIIPTSLVATLFPALSTLNEQGQWEKLEILVSRSVKYLLLILGPVVIIIVVYAREIMRAWLGSEFAEAGVLVFKILAAGTLINSLSKVPYSLLQALGRPDLTAKFHLVELPLHSFLVWGLVSVWGIAGAALAWSIRVAVDALLVFIAAFRLSRLSVRPFLADKIPQVVISLGVVGWFVVGVAAMPITAWLRLLILALVFLILAGGSWRYFLDDRERNQVFKVFRVFKRKVM